MKKRKSRIPAQKREFSGRMAEILGSESQEKAFFEALKDLALQGPRSLRLNRLKKFKLDLLKKTGLHLTSPVSWCEGGFFLDKVERKDLVANPSVGAGLVYLQEAGAMEAVEILGPQPGDLVLDLCAAPGGKATQIGERLAGEGWLVANDPVRSRAFRLDAILARHGIDNVSVYSLDPKYLSSVYSNFFDKILVDAPCSGESLFAKRKELRVDVRDADVLGCARRQFAILKEASKMLKVGGMLVYSTCTYSREENEDLIGNFVKDEVDSGVTWKIHQEYRRWPHVDQVAGGYCVKIELVERKIESPLRYPKSIDVNGLLRHSWLQWNGQPDLYAASMLGRRRSFNDLVKNFPVDWLADFFEKWDWPPDPDFEKCSVTLDQARSYLRGESLMDLPQSQKGLQSVVWENWPLGVARGTGDRLNNQLPKILRELL